MHGTGESPPRTSSLVCKLEIVDEVTVSQGWCEHWISQYLLKSSEKLARC
jgi:hypothetical protein